MLLSKRWACKRPTTFIQTMVSSYQDSQAPPLCSSTLPKCEAAMMLEWLQYKLKRQTKMSKTFGDSLWGLTQRVLKKLNRPFDVTLLDWNKTFHVGLRNMPEWVLSPSDFDFPRKASLPFQKHIGPTIDLDRKEGFEPPAIRSIETK